MQVRRRFGQHFLHDGKVIRRIVDAIAPLPAARVIEVGPGRGALTWPLLALAGALDVVEIDRDLAALLGRDPRAGTGLRIHVQDVLHTDFAMLRAGGPALRIVGNLPYNISTPLLFRLLEQREAIADMHFMLQKEVVERMTAAPGNKQYGRLTVMLAAAADVEHLFDVGPEAFRPRPKVVSAMVRIRPLIEPRFAAGAPGALRTLVTAAFSQRRKTLRNSLMGILSAEDIECCGIDPMRRPETLSPAQFAVLAAHHSQLYSNR